MAQAQQQIELFHTLFQVCLSIFIVGLILSVLFFFLFNIRKIFNSRSGRSVKRAVQAMEESNARTGKLAVPNLNMEPERSGDFTVKSGEMARSGRLHRSGRMGRTAKTVPSVSEGNVVTTVLYNDNIPDTSTAVQTDQSYGKFIIEKRIFLVHTNEVL